MSYRELAELTLALPRVAAGAEYNHVVNVETFPFDRPLGSSADPSAIPVEGEQRAPSCVREACEHVSAIASLACTNAAATGTVFNEVLSVAYSTWSILAGSLASC